MELPLNHQPYQEASVLTSCLNNLTTKNKRKPVTNQNQNTSHYTPKNSNQISISLSNPKIHHLNIITLQFNIKQY